MNADPVLIAVAVVGLLGFLVFMALFYSVTRLWVQAHLTRTNVSFLDIVRMRLRRVPPAQVVHAAIALKQKGIDVPVAEIEKCYLAAGGTVVSPTGLAALVLETRSKSEG